MRLDDLMRKITSNLWAYSRNEKQRRFYLIDFFQNHVNFHESINPSYFHIARSTQQDQHNKILHSKHTMLCNLNSLKAYITTSTITYTDNKHAREAIPEPSTKCCSAAAPPKTSPAFPFSTDTATPASVPTFPFTAES